MYRYRFFRDDTGEELGICTVDSQFTVIGERIGSIVIDGKDLPGTVTKVNHVSDMEGNYIIHGSIWVKQDKYE